jgi:hypothetical protein
LSPVTRATTAFAAILAIAVLANCSSAHEAGPTGRAVTTVAPPTTAATAAPTSVAPATATTGGSPGHGPAGQGPAALAVTATAAPDSIGVCAPGCVGHPAGSAVEFTIEVRNTGGVPDAETALHADLPLSLGNVEVSGACHTDALVAATLDCRLGTLDPGATASVAIVATLMTAPANGRFQVTFTATSGAVTASAQTSTAVRSTGGGQGI